MRTDLDELAALPDPQKEQLARDVLDALRVDVKRLQGDELIIACPVGTYHQDQDRNPTAALSTSKLLFHCLGCQSSGTVLWLIATLHDDIDTIEQAREWLHGAAGLSRAMALPNMLAFFDSLYTPQRPAPMPVYSPRMLAGWQENGVPAYITGERGIHPDYAREMGVCTDPEGRVYGRATGPRAVIPHYWQGQLVGWQSRRLPEADPTAPKYHSTPGFPKDETLYCPISPRWINPRSQRRRAVIVESPMSALRHGTRRPMKATFGATITDIQVQLICQLPYDEIVFWLDNDRAGWEATFGRSDRWDRHYPGVPERVSHHKMVYVVENPFDADPADLSDDVVDLLIDVAVPWPVWLPPRTLEPVPA